MLSTELNIFFAEINELKEPDFNFPNIGKIAIDKWFDEIHLLDKFLGLQEIISFLAQTNQYRFPNTDRLYLLEKLTAPICSLVGNIKPNFLNTPLPLTKEHNKDISFCTSVFHQLVVAYSIILNDQIANQNLSWIHFRANNQKLALTIQRLTRLISQILLIHFETYQKTDKHLWEKLYTLYTYAERKKLADIQIFDSIIENKTSIKETFLQILLLALIDPYHLNQLHTYYTYKHLSHWARLVKLASQKKPNLGRYTTINYFDSHMPTFSINKIHTNTENFLFINTQKLSLQALNEDSKTTSGFLSPKVKASLLKQLETKCSKHINRVFERKNYFVKLKVVFGLRNVHYALNHFKNPQWLKKPNFSSIDISSDTFNYEQILNSTQNQTNIENICDDRNIIKRFLSENRSQNGFRLIPANNCTFNVKIGDIIALSYEKSELPNNWCVGVVRRIQHFYGHPLNIGVQQLSPTGSVPISIKLKNQYQHYRAIVLPPFPDSIEHETLLTETMAFNLGDFIEIENCETLQEENTQITKELFEDVETTPFYTRFKLKS